MKLNKKICVVFVMLCMMSIFVSKTLAESKYASNTLTTGVAVNFGANPDSRVIKYVSAKTGTTDAEIKIYARDGSAYYPTATPTNGAVLILITNTGITLTNSDLVIYQHASGTLDYTTVSSATATSVTLAAGISVAGATGDAIYELSQQGSLYLPITNGSGIASAQYSGDVFKSPAGSPVRVLCAGATNNVISVTVQ